MGRVPSTVLFVVFLSAWPGSARAQDAPPAGPFKAVHLVNLTEAQAAAVLAALGDMNAAVAKAGHPDIRYRLYRVTGKQAGPYNYLWESVWPSGAVYTKVHDSPDWAAASKKHPELDALMKNEIYNRYVEVPAKK